MTPIITTSKKMMSDAPDTYFYDLELFPNCFMCSFMEREEHEVHTVTLHPSKRSTDDLDRLLRLFRSGGYFVGYNNQHFDDPIMNFLLNTNAAQRSREEVITEAFDLAQQIVEGDSIPNHLKYAEYFKSIDLMMVGNLYTKSLKQIAINLKWPVIQDFPYGIDHHVQADELGELRDYNHNDVGITEALFEELKDDINLRLFISRNEGVDVLSRPNSTIADILLEKKYSQQTQVPRRVFVNDQTTYSEKIDISEVIVDDVDFQTSRMQDVLRDLKNESIYPGGNFKREFTLGRQKYTVAKGGLHSNHDGEWIEPGPKEHILEADVSSYYPFLIFQYNFCPDHLSSDFVDILENITRDRIQDKREENWTASAAKKIVINCFTPDHEVMTTDGVKNIEEVNEGDLVYSKNPDTGAVELKPVTRTYRQDKYNGPMCKMENENIDLLVTPNHRMLTRQFKGEHAGDYEWKNAEDVIPGRCRHQLPRHEPVEGRTPNHIRLSEFCDQLDVEYKLNNGRIKYDRQQDQWIPNVYNAGDWLELMGWYISEGSLYRSSKKEYENTTRGRSTNIVLSEQGCGQQIIADLLQRMGLSFHRGDDEITVGNEILFRILRHQCGKGSANKRIPKWVFDLDGSIALHLWRAMMKGDGHKTGFTYTTKSDELAKDFRSLSAQCGYICHYQSNDGCHRLGVNYNQGHSPILRSTEREMVDYKGPIVCLEVADNHTVLAGRNSKLNWVGQSVYGKSRDDNSWMHDPMVTYQTTINGQLFLLMLIERLEEAGMPVVYANTDGINVRVPDSKVDLYHSICNAWEQHTGFVLDHEEFQFMALADVNNYIWQKDDGSLKRKGRLNKNRHKGSWGLARSFDMPVVPMAVEEYFVNDTPPEETIRNHDDVYDFCTTQNVGKKFDIVYKTIEDNQIVTKDCQRTNRWYVANMGGALIKKTDSKEQLLESGEHVRLLNNPPTEEDRKAVREQYYIQKARQEIEPIANRQLSLV